MVGYETYKLLLVYFVARSPVEKLPCAINHVIHADALKTLLYAALPRCLETNFPYFSFVWIITIAGVDCKSSRYVALK